MSEKDPGFIKKLSAEERRRLLRDARAAKLPSTGTVEEAISPINRNEPMALSFAQQRLWVLSQLEPNSAAYHMSECLRLRGVLDKGSLKRALNRIVARHDILRTRFVRGGDQPMQLVASEGSECSIEEIDLRNKDGRSAGLESALTAEASRAFDLERGPLIRGLLVQMEAGDHVLMLTMHHIVSDGWSIGVMVNELSLLYAAFTKGEVDPLQSLPVQYADYAAWQRKWLAGEALAKQTAYWKKALSGAPARLELLTDRPRPAEQDHRGDSAVVELGLQLTKEIGALSQQHGLSPYMTLLAGWAATLGRLTGQEEVVIGSPVAGRARSEVEPLIGFFVNTVAIRLRTGGTTVGELLKQTKQQVLEAQEHQDVPFDQVVDTVQPMRTLAHTPVCQVMLAWQNMPEGRLDLPGLELSSISRQPATAQCDLTLELKDGANGIGGMLNYATALFERSTVDRYVAYFRNMLRGMVRDDRADVSRVSLMSPEETRQVIDGWNATEVEYPTHRCLHELFEDQVNQTPESVALTFDGESLTYSELNARANRLARHLRDLGVGPDRRVGICLERSFEMMVALLATLKAGGCYVPLDPEYPTRRLKEMVDDSEPVAIVTLRRLESVLATTDERCQMVKCDDESATWTDRDPSNLSTSEIGLAPNHLAYVIYTSGSTGVPKGAMNEHRGVVNRLLWMRDAYAFDEDEVLLQKTPISFDVSVWELFGALISGGRLVIARPGGHRDQRYLGDVIRSTGVTTVHFVPAMLQVFLDSEAGQLGTKLRRVICSGESLHAELVRRFHRTLPGIQLENLYGPTEAGVDVTAWHCVAGDERVSVPIGRPVANTRIYVLDSKQQPVPVGVPGELFIGGVQVGRGYLNQPELTASRFVSDPFNTQVGTRMYKTGDVARWLSDGTIQYLGRNDFQVKVRGFRIELGEIEARLREVPGVAEVVVVAREEGEGEKRLVAYYTGEEAPEAEALRARVGQVLPEYMVPAAYVRLEGFPLTANGKLDRKALPAPDDAAFVSRGYVAPEGRTEETLARLWSELLKVERVGRNDNFFELGGHSLLAVKLVERMRQLGLHADVRSLFTTSTLAELARVTGAERAEVEVPPNLIPEGATAITPEMLPLVRLTQAEIDEVVAKVPGGAANVQDIYPLAPLQEGILFHHITGGQGDPYVLPSVLRFADHERLKKFVETLERVIERHDILRTAVLWEGLEEPVQVVQRRVKMIVETVAFEGGQGEVVEQLKSKYDPRHYRVDVRQAPLLRGFAAAEGESGRWLLLVLAHHLALDHTTMDLLVEEAGRIQVGQIQQLPHPVPFRNFVGQARLGVSREEHEVFFERMLGDVDEPTAPFGLTDVRDGGRYVREARTILEPSLSRAVRERARQLGVSAASLMHLAWALVLARVSGRTDVVFGTVMLGRMQGGEGAERVLGMFINTLPMRVKVERGIKEGIQQTHGLLWELIRHEHASLSLAQRCSGVPAQVPLFSSLFNYRHSPMPEDKGTQEADEGTDGIEVVWSEERSNYPVVVSVDDLGRDFMLTAQVSAPVEAEQVCRYMETAVGGLVRMLEEAPETRLEEVDVMPGAERRQVLEEWNATGKAYGSARCFHELFEEQVERGPENIALVCGEESLSYGELNARANRLGHHLRSLGVAAGKPVAVCMRRSAEMVVGVLAVLKAGGCYVPLDPGYPEARLEFMLRDSSPAVVLVDDVGRAALANERKRRFVDVKEDAARWSGESASNPRKEDTGLTAEDAAYIIYTSGSTGEPKGVINEHRGLSNLLRAELFGLGSGSRLLQCASLSFDASVWEMGMALASGASLVVAAKAEETYGRGLVAALEDYGITHVFLTPAVLATCEESERQFSAKTLIVGGEAISVEEANKWSSRVALFNAYGPTEAAISTTVHRCQPESRVVPIGRPIPNARVYVLDANRQPMPVGVAGEIYIGGAGVARGYLNRPELTAERFLADPFSVEAGARMYKTGDVGRWLADGTVEYLGRNDFQVKVRGFRIELGEIEARLREVPGVVEVVVVAREEGGGEKRLVAYYTGEEAPEAEVLRSRVGQVLPEYMVPAAYVRLEGFPLTANGKLDRKALPAPDDAAFVSRGYVAPEGRTEETLARLWSELLKVERVGRNDNFFELGGHSLLAVKLVERMRQLGLHADVRSLFTTSTLAELARVTGAERAEVEVPPNLIPEGATAITPEMLPLVRLTQAEIDEVVAKVPGGAANVQDIYPLAPLQEGILFHHITGGQGDPYVLPSVLRFADHERLKKFVETLERVIERHDILRTAVLWEGLEEPVQVVQRRVKMIVETVAFEGGQGEVVEQLKSKYDPRHYRVDVRQAPLLRGFAAAEGESGRWLLLVLAHHLALDHTTLDILIEETELIEAGRGKELVPAIPFRSFVAQSRLGVSREEHEAFFEKMLADVTEPTAPFGLTDVLGDDRPIDEWRAILPASLSSAVREQARRRGVSVASVMHLAWALVLARVSGREDVVFGTVMLGRMQGGEGADRVLGMFINTLPLRMKMEGTVEESVRETHGLLSELMCHEHAPLSLAQRCSGVPAQAPLFSSLFNYRHSSLLDGESVRTGEGEGGDVEVVWADERTNYPVAVSVDDGGRDFMVTAQVSTPVRAERVCRYMETAISELVNALEESPRTRLEGVDVMPSGERYEVVERWNATEVEYPTHRCLHELFEDQVNQTPEAVALTFDGESLTYSELNARANRLARHLRDLGVGPDRRVGICLERSFEMMVALLATLKAGGCYVPLDPEYPTRRLKEMVDDSEPVAIVTLRRLESVLATTDERCQMVKCDDESATWTDRDPSNLSTSEIGLAPNHLAYVIYTSGSTGVPKGAMNEHRGVVNRLLWMRDAYAFDEDEVLLQKTPISFDVSVWELFGALISGGRLVIARPGGHRDQRYLGDVIRSTGVTTVHFVPAMLQVFLDSEAGQLGTKLRRVICSGESLHAELVRRFHRTLPGIQLENLYGPTEAGVDVTAWHCVAGDERVSVPIGRPVANTRIYVLDSKQQPVPVGVPGELFIGGVQVGRGYLNQPELTASRFVSDPFNTQVGTRMYKTGDVARWLSDGTIQYLGRNDFQVKVRGFRIELGEIEARLREVPGVVEVVVVAREEGEGEKRLVAYYTGEEAPEAEALRARVGQVLPEYMVPAAYVRLEGFPLTANGKLDRKALPAPDDAAFVSRGYVAPEGRTEETLARLWSELLKVERVGRNDNFFELGGHSLLAVKLVERMRQCGLRGDVRALFTSPALAELARVVVGVEGEVEIPPNVIPDDATAITPEMLPLVGLKQREIDEIVRRVPGGARNVQDVYPLAPLQEGILFHHTMGGEGDTYLQSTLLRFGSRERLEKFVKTLQRVVERHDILRTAVLWEGLEEPVQVVHRQAKMPVEIVEFDPGQGEISEQLKTKYNPRKYRLDVRKAPLLAGFAAAEGESGRWLLLVLAHHLALDHTTLEVLVEETEEIEAGRGDELPAPVPFRNFVARARLGVSREEHQAFFKEMMGDVDEPTAPFGLMDVQGDGSEIDESQMVLDGAVSQGLREGARRLGVSAASLMHLAWALVLARVSARNDVVFGTVMLGRMQGGAGADRVLGMFINTLPMRVKIDGSVKEAARRTHGSLSDLIRHEHAPLALAQRCSGVPPEMPLFSSLFNYRHSPTSDGDRTEVVDPAREHLEVVWSQERTNYPLALSVDDFGLDFMLTVQARAPVEAVRVCRYMETAVAGLVRMLEEEPETRLAQIDVVPAAERCQVLEEWNPTVAKSGPRRCVHELFEEQADRVPENTALVYGETSLTYRELNARANRLAHQLRVMGVQPDARVAICMERSIEMIVAMLATVKAGGAYVPLDPGHPADRVSYVIADSAPVLVLADDAGRGALGGVRDLRILDVKYDERLWWSQPETNLRPLDIGLTPAHLAYVIYTSGSTGVPKGVMNEHGALSNLIVAQRELFALDAESRVLQFSSLSFDASFSEIGMALGSGARLYLAQKDQLVPGRPLLGSLKKHQITHVTLIPSALALCDDPSETFTANTLVVAGEAVSVEEANKWSARLTLFNGYGPTEAAVCATVHRCQPESRVVPIGRPIPNARVYVLDANREPVPVGVAGEIYIGGAGVARGYLNRPELTAERFLADPFSVEAGARMYKTGDVGRWLADGTVEYLGRNDFQVKVRGFRIELGEIEARLREVPGVVEVVVVAREEGGGEKRLVAYYTGEEAPEAEVLRSRVGQVLPEYMVPAAYVRLEGFPLTANGKLDRKALPAPNAASYVSRGYEAPRGEVEEPFARVWTELLKVERVGRNDNFFELGGHSLLAMQLISRVRQELRVELQLARVFDKPVLKDLAEEIVDGRRAEVEEIRGKVDRGAGMAVSPAQQRLWFLSQLEGGNPAYHISACLRMRGVLDEASLGRALDRMVARHEVLRTRFVQAGGRPMQVIDGVGGGFSLTKHDLRASETADVALDGVLAQEGRRAFELERGPLIRGQLVQMGAEDNVLMVTMHHIVSDGWSMSVFVSEVSTLYKAFTKGEEDPLEPLALQYADYAAWQRERLAGEELNRQGKYWKETLTGAPSRLSLPADRMRLTEQDYRGASIGVELGPDLSRAVKALSQRHGVTSYMTLLAAWGATLGRLAGQEEVVIGSPVAGRSRVELEGLIGFFVNTLAIRLRTGGDETVAELLAQTKRQVLGAQGHQDLPFEQVVEVLEPVRSLAHTPVFQVMFAWQSAPEGTLDLPGLELSTVERPRTTAQFDLALELQDDETGILGTLNYATALFDRMTVERYAEYFRNMVEGMVRGEVESVSRIPLMTVVEREEVLEKWNGTGVEYPRRGCLQEVFEEQVERTPEAVAVVAGEESLTYGELNAQANRLARHLRRLGVGPDVRVGICVERSLGMMVGLLGTLKAGGCYVPLDPQYPRERLRQMIEDSTPAVVLTAGGLDGEAMGEIGARTVSLKDEAAGWRQEEGGNLAASEVGLTEEHLAYVIYTSGSTGRPKGVAIPHSAIVNHMRWMIGEFGITAEDVILQRTSLSFDASVWECYAALLVGGRLVLAPMGLAADLKPLCETIASQQVSVMQMVPSLLQMMVKESELGRCTSLRYVFCGGEALTVEQVRAVRALVPATVVNLYGPTETTIDATFHRCGAEEDGAGVPIGRPVANTRVYVLDEEGEPSPIGVAGELYIGGAQVARGYLNQPELTANRFLADRFSGEAGARMYRTGDVGRWRADGRLEYLGRNDDQVKVRGFRIELGEIESQLRDVEGVGEVVVVAREEEGGEKRLVAYYTGEEAPGTEVLRTRVREALPEYMVPAAYVRLEQMPLTPNGKLDRRALPAPDSDAYVSREYEAPQGEVEETLARLWSELLNVERVGRHDNFFELGGHSLMAVRLLARIGKELLVEVSLNEIFGSSALSSLATKIARATKIEPSTIQVRRARSAPAPLSLAQRRLWILTRLGGVHHVYLMSGVLRMRGLLDKAALKRALDHVVTRHEVLRTRFVQVDAEPMQVVKADTSGVAFLEDDLSGSECRQQMLNDLLDAEATATFDLERGELIRARLVQIDLREHILIVTMHHIVSDGWSVGILVNELSALYGAFMKGGEDPLPPLAIQYADYAEWQRKRLTGDELRAQGAYWREALAGAPARLKLATDRPRPAEQNYRGASIAVGLDSELSEELNRLSRRHGVTPYMTLLAAWGATLARLAGQEEVVVGSPVAGRRRVDVEPLIGFFVNTLAIRLRIGRDTTVTEFLERTKDQVLKAQEHQDVPFEQVVELLQPARSLAHAPIFQVMFAWQNAPEGKLHLQGLELSGVHRAVTTAPFDLTLDLQDGPGGIAGTLNYATALFDSSTVERYVEYFRNMLRGVVRGKETVVSRIPLMPGAERRQVLEEWNATGKAYGSARCFHELFEEQVERGPENIALVCGEESLSYGELNARANRLGHHLRSLGVAAGKPVAVCMRRSAEMVVGVLAVLKAGGCYVPLDPGYPEARLEFMLRDSSPAVVLVDDVGRAALANERKRRFVDVKEDAARWSGESASNPRKEDTGLTAEDAAYIIYTSGSTGEPKGVINEHRGLSNLLRAELFGLGSGSRLLQCASLSFDASVWEMGMALASGASLVVAAKAEETYGRGLLAALEDYGITHVFLTPAVLATCEESERQFSAKTLIVGGEAISVEEANKWSSRVALFNAYGPTEAAISTTVHRCQPESKVVPIGRPIPNAKVYVLDANREPVPVGVAGEIYIGGAGVARGYLNRPELTAERFLADPFSGEAEARMYKTGDVGRWLADGTVEYLGRNDFQVKVRGFRIELGEIEARLREVPGVVEVVVVAREEGGGEKRLVAYYTGEEAPEAEVLRSRVGQVLPEYMVPAAYVRLEGFPLTANGKLDRKALPAPDDAAFVSRGYVAPEGRTEETLARVWSELLKVERVGRNDNFFDLGGHSLTAVTLVERMRQLGLEIDVRSLFTTSTLAELAGVAATERAEVEVPPNLIPEGATAITPEMLPLVRLTQAEIDEVVAKVPGGAVNVQDIYPLAPLQEGMLFHHMLGGEGDTYLQPTLLRFGSRGRLDSFVRTLETAIERHDILRTAVIWEGLEEPVQVVHRRAKMVVETIAFDPSHGAVLEQVKRKYGPRRYRLDVRQAPLLRGFAAEEERNGGWLLLVLAHHLALDHTTLDLLVKETEQIEMGRSDELARPVPYRNFVAQSRLGMSRGEHEAFFQKMLGDVDEPTIPFGLADVRGGDVPLRESRITLEPSTSLGIREYARRLGVSAASLMHLAWALVLARVSGRRDVVFGTVMLGRMQGGAGVGQVLGMFINTLPARVKVEGEVEEAARRMHRLLADLIQHEHAPLAVTERCSGVPAQTPLFSSLFNYRHSLPGGGGETGVSGTGVEPEVVWSEERTNYPIAVAIDDLGDNFTITAQVSAPIEAERVCRYVERAISELVKVSEGRAGTRLERIDVMTVVEREEVLEKWNGTGVEYPRRGCLQEVFEEQVKRTPEAVAVVAGEESLTYGELNAQANRLARHLRRLGVGPDVRVGICVERSLGMMVGLLGTLKAGGCYVPLDPQYPRERLRQMIEDSTPAVVLTAGGLDGEAMGEIGARTVSLKDEAAGWRQEEGGNLAASEVGLTEEHLAYVIYTSGSTGRPKGVAIPHSAIVNHMRWMIGEFGITAEDVILQRTSLSFDASVWECYAALLVGGRLVLAPMGLAADLKPLCETIASQQVSVMQMVPSLLQMMVKESELGRCTSLRYVFCGGEALTVEQVRAVRALVPATVVNLYGPTETTIDATFHRCGAEEDGAGVPIGRPVANTRVYVLDEEGEPSPIGVAGELYIGGAQVARGYLNQPELTANRFLADRFSGEAGARMYRTGDVGRWRADGRLEYLGRNDDQVKVRGFRIELGEIESQLRDVEGVGEVVVVAREEEGGEKRLVAYYTGEEAPGTEVLRTRVREALPEYMVPAAYVRLEQMPLTPNGKLDRRALPAPDSDAYVSREYEAPQGEVEETLARLWSELLNVERVGRHDNFFELGGHSLTAIQLVSRVRQALKVNIELRQIFDVPVLSQLVGVMSNQNGGQSDAIRILPRKGKA